MDNEMIAEISGVILFLRREANDLNVLGKIY